MAIFTLTMALIIMPTMVTKPPTTLKIATIGTMSELNGCRVEHVTTLKGRPSALRHSDPTHQISPWPSPQLTDNRHNKHKQT